MVHTEKRGAPGLPPSLTFANVHLAFGIPSATVRHWVRTGQLQAVKVGGKWYVQTADIERLFAEKGDA